VGYSRQLAMQNYQLAMKNFSAAMFVKSVRLAGFERQQGATIESCEAC